MKTKTLSIFVLAGVVALSSVAAITMLNQQNNHVEVEGEPTGVSYPYEIPHWQGVPTLAMNPSPSERTDYHELAPENYAWLQRLVDNTETIVTDKEIREFFDLADDNYLFKVNGEIYTIHYVDNPTIRLDQHYIKLFPSDELSENAQIVSKQNHSWLQKGLSNPYKWVPVSEAELSDYKTLTLSSRDIAIDNTGYNLRYIGSDLPQLENKEYQEIFNKSIGIFQESTP